MPTGRVPLNAIVRTTSPVLASPLGPEVTSTTCGLAPSPGYQALPTSQVGGFRYCTALSVRSLPDGERGCEPVAAGGSLRRWAPCRASRKTWLARSRLTSAPSHQRSALARDRLRRPWCHRGPARVQLCLLRSRVTCVFGHEHSAGAVRPPEQTLQGAARVLASAHRNPQRPYGWCTADHANLGTTPWGPVISACGMDRV